MFLALGKYLNILRDFGTVGFPGDPDTGCVCIGRLRCGSKQV